MLTVAFLLSTFAFAQHYTQTNLLTDGITVTPPRRNPPMCILRIPRGFVRSASSPLVRFRQQRRQFSSSHRHRIGDSHQPKRSCHSPECPKPTGAGIADGNRIQRDRHQLSLAPGDPAAFIFVTEDGTISGWNPTLNRASAVIMVDHSQVPNAENGAVFEGATISEAAGAQYLYVTNFRAGRVEVYDSSFHQIRLPDGFFDDDHIPWGFAPFNIQAIGKNIYVTYAKQDAAKHDDVAGAGLGFVDVFSPYGKLLARLEHGRWLNAPWGVVLAPSEFGELSHSILVGNFGSGWISAFNPVTGKFEGFVKNPDDSILTIDGLWGLNFGNGGTAGPLNTLYFTAVPNGENDGLFGTLTPVSAELNEEDEP